MDSKKEKYYNFIVDDLVSKIVFDEDDTIIYPFELESRAITSAMNFSIRHNFLWEFRNYVNKAYGTIDDEDDLVWDRFQKRMRVYNYRINSYTLIKNNG